MPNMKMLQTTIATLALTYFLLACGQQPSPPTQANTPTTTETQILGAFQSSVGNNSSNGGSVDIQPTNPRGLENPLPFTLTKYASGVVDNSSTIQRYMYAKYNVQNTTTHALTNLSLYMLNRVEYDAIGGTAFSSVRNANGVVFADPNVARGIRPSHDLTLNGSAFQINPNEADFQAFTPSEAQNIDNQAKITSYIPTNNNVLEWGFMVRGPSGSRTLQPGQTGQVTFGFVTPLTASLDNTVRNASFWFVAVTEPTKRITRGLNETTVQAQTRAATIGATEIALVGTDTDTAIAPYTTVRLPAVKWFVPSIPDQPTMTLNATGGFARLGNFIADVPSGALNSATTFTLFKPAAIPAPLPTTDEFMLSQVPGAQVVTTYKITSSVAQFQNPIQIVIPIDVLFQGNVVDYVTELYRWDGSSYTTLRIDKGATTFLYEPIRLAAGGDTFMAVRAPISAVITACTARAGVFNGVYCELPFDSVANSAAVQPGNTRARALDQYKMVSFNVGNALQSGPYNQPFYCGNTSSTDVATSAYVFKLCSYAVERRVRDALRQDGNSGQLDLLALQELWNNDCSTSLDVFVTKRVVLTQGPINYDSGDRICAAPTTTPGKIKQIERLIPTTTFDYHCSPIRSFPSSPRLSKRKTNGYECIAIRRQHFEFTLPEFSTPTIQPACPGATQSSTVYYEGSDTGFQVENVRLKGSLGPVADATFDFINTHMIGATNADCRRTQLNTLYTSYRIGINPKPTRILIAGDFNTTTVIPLIPDITTTYFNTIINSLNTPVNAFTGAKLGYFVSNPLEITTNFIGLQYGFDHIITNFADSASAGTACVRVEVVYGTDHKRTVCTLTGFDSGKVRATIQLLDTSDPSSLFTAWSGGTVAASRRGVKLTYVKTTLGTFIYDSTGLPSSLPTALTYQACSIGATKILTNTVLPGGTVTNGVVKFAEYVPISCP
jgi:hypothetical protein